MVKLSSAQAHPAFVQSMLRSMCFHQMHDGSALTKESLIATYGIAGRGSEMGQTLTACKDIGAVAIGSNGAITVSEEWVSAITSSVPRESLAQKVAASLKPGDDLYELCAGLLRTAVLTEKTVDEWREDWPGPSAEAPFKTDVTPRNNTIFWMQYLGWVRPLGKNHYIPDFTHWVESWMRRVKPAGQRVLLREVWEDWSRGLPPLQTIHVEDGVPDAMGVALDAIKRRGFAHFHNEADTSVASLQWQVGDDRRAFRFVDWLSQRGAA